MPESDSLASAEDIRESVIPPTWPEPSPLLYGRRASLGALRDSISEEDAADLSDAALQAIRADAIARWAQRTDPTYLKRALDGIAAELERMDSWLEHEARRRQHAWIKILVGLGLVWLIIAVLLHWK